jgi:hypothetical protein
MKRKRAGAVLAVAAVAVGLTVPGGAVAKISPASCTNSGGNQPGGQQPVCQGGGLNQEPATNPSGNAPPGQQP